MNVRVMRTERRGQKKSMKMNSHPPVQASLNKKVQKRRKHFTGGRTRTYLEKQVRGGVAGIFYTSDATQRLGNIKEQYFHDVMIHAYKALRRIFTGSVAVYHRMEGRSSSQRLKTKKNEKLNSFDMTFFVLGGYGCADATGRSCRGYRCQQACTTGMRAKDVSDAQRVVYFTDVILSFCGGMFRKQYVAQSCQHRYVIEIVEREHQKPIIEAFQQL